MKVSVLIPAYNEEDSIEATIDSMRGALPGAELLVIDDCSSDSTAALASAREVTVLRHERNRGKAGALITGLKKSSGQVVAMVDGDMGSCAGEISQLVEAVADNQCDLAIAIFASSRGGGVGLVRNLARWGIFLLTKSKLRAPLSGQRAATRTLLEQCLPHRGGFGLETELTLNALRRGYRIREYATGFVHQGHGWSRAGFCHRGRQFFHVLAALWRGGMQWLQH
jgi:glycosyltransferase involved in cell wall biosynthesis